ncbi:MAG: UDP-glycosyltransferase [Bacteroidetes bacterium]|nr:UDP-glycosyltransferase [Bacteroidota bacterium]
MKVTKKILVVVESIDVDDSSGSKGRVALITNLITIGYNLKVYHYTQKNINIVGADCMAISERKWNILYVLSRTQRVFTRWTGININPLIERFFGFSFTFLNDVKSIVKALKHETNFEPDLVLTLSKGMSYRPHSALLKLTKFHDKWMAYVHDPYPYHYYPIPYKWTEPGYKIKENFFREVADKAKFSVFPSKLLMEWMGGYYPNFLNTGLVIPHQNNSSKIPNTNLILPDFFDATKFNILHAGSLIGGRSPKGLISAFKMFIEGDQTIKKESRLILIGNNSYYKEWIDNEVKGVGEIIVIGENLPFDLVYELQHLVTVNVILEANTAINPFLPGKFPHCVNAKKPILALTSQNSELMRLLGSEYEIWSNPDDEYKIVSILNQLYSKWKENPKLLKLERSDLEEYLSIKNLKNSIESILETSI